MQWLASISVRRPVFATVLILVIVVVGLVGYRGLGVDKYPDVDFPAVTVVTLYPGAAPPSVETDVTEKIESAVKDAETLLKKDDATKEALEAQSESLGKAAQKLGEIMYAEAQAKSESAGPGPGGGSAGGGAAGGEAGKKEETVVDAEYTEVKDKQ